MKDLRHTSGRLLGAVRRRRPLIHNITNYVAMSSSANVLIDALDAVGAPEAATRIRAAIERARRKS